MSKKSTTRPGSEGDCELRSARSQIEQTDRNSFSGNAYKSDHKQCPVGDTTHKISVLQCPNRQPSLQKLNHASVIRSENSSDESVDGELYKSNNIFLDNLNSLRRKLNLIIISEGKDTVDTERSRRTTATSSEKSQQHINVDCSHTAKRLKSRTSNFTLAASPTSFVLGADNRTSKQESILDNGESFSMESCRNTSSSLSSFGTIFKANSMFESDTTISISSSETASLPCKRLCTRDKTPTFLPLGKVSTIEITNENEKANLISSSRSANSYSVPHKKVCIRDGTPGDINEMFQNPAIEHKNDIINNAYFGLVHKCIECHKIKSTDLKYPCDNSSIQDNVDSIRSEFTSEDICNHQNLSTCSSERSTNSEFYLNLPCSIQENSCSSLYPTPIEPKVIVLNNQDSPPFKSQPGSALSSKSITPCSSTGRSYIIVQDNSHYENFTVSPKFSETCFPSITSSRSSSTSALSKTMSVFLEGEIDLETQVIDPMPESSLDLPKKSAFLYEFPAFTKITCAPELEQVNKDLGNFSNQIKESRFARIRKFVSASSSETSSISTARYSTYKNAALRLIKSPTFSPTKRVMNLVKAPVSSEIISPDLNKESQILLAVRKTQSVNNSFYSIPSPTGSENSFEGINVKERDSDRDTEIDDACHGCGCMHLLFSRKRRRFFP